MSSRFKFSLFIVMGCVLYIILQQSPVFGSPFQGSSVMGVNSFLSLLTLALVIERIIEINILLIPGMEEKKNELEYDPDALVQFKLKIRRFTLIGAMVLGIVGCVIFKFGILDEIFPNGIGSTNLFNLVLTGLIAGSIAEPVHHMVIISLGIRERLRVLRHGNK